MVARRSTTRSIPRSASRWRLAPRTQRAGRSRAAGLGLHHRPTGSAGILAAERHRRKPGRPTRRTALKDMALAMLGNLGIIGEVAINGVDRPKYGNSLYGAYAQDFVCREAGGSSFRAHDPAMGQPQGGDPYASRLRRADRETWRQTEPRRRALQAPPRHHCGPEAVLRHAQDRGFAKTFDERGVTWSQYRSFKECVEQDPDCSTDNPMF